MVPVRAKLALARSGFAENGPNAMTYSTPPTTPQCPLHRHHRIVTKSIRLLTFEFEPVLKRPLSSVASEQKDACLERMVKN
jgi:hypothetical protein